MVNEPAGPNDGGGRRDRSGLLVLDRSECLHLMATTVPHVGRVALVDGEGRPFVLPVNYQVDGESVVFRTAEGGLLDAAVAGTLVAFELDAVDPAWQEGWSVLAHGVARAVADPDEIARLERLPLRPWAPGDRHRWVRLPVQSVSGRRIV